ncbi:MAG: cadherin-like beta sandwich domain-containing protein [Bacilli bacterium]|nr:cadherin-like beta sandwich domain-containing protein [Bacilli bacterium]
MKKIYTIITIVISLLFITNVKADGTSATLTPSPLSCYEGETCSITLNLNSNIEIGGVSYKLSYDTSMLEFVDGKKNKIADGIIQVIDEPRATSASYTYKFKSLKTGESTVKIVSMEVSDANEEMPNDITPSTLPSASVSMTTRPVTAPTTPTTTTKKSNNANLSNLSIDGVSLTPAFNSSTTTYTASLNPDATSINISASTENSGAKVSGAGTIPVSKGNNNIEIKVTAEDGTTKTYTITANVPDSTVGTINDKNIVTKSDDNPISDSFSETTINIDGQDVPAYYNDATGTTIVAVDNGNGEVEYYTVDEDGNLGKYDEVDSDKIDLMSLAVALGDVPEGYVETTIIIDGKEYKAYKKADDSRFVLLYGTNLATGDTGFFVYDTVDRTIQKYDVDSFNDLLEKNAKLWILLWILIFTCIGLLILLIIALILLSKRDKVIKKYKNYIQGKKEEINEERS